MFTISRWLNKKRLNASAPVSSESNCVWLEQDPRFASIANALKIIQTESTSETYTLKILVDASYKDAIFKAYSNVSLTILDNWHVINGLRLSDLKALIDNVIELAYFACENKENKMNVSDMLRITNLYVYIYSELELKCPYQLSQISEANVLSSPVVGMLPSTVPSAEPPQIPSLPTALPISAVMTTSLFSTGFGLFATPSSHGITPNKDSSAGSYTDSSSGTSALTSTTSSLIRDTPSR